MRPLSDSHLDTIAALATPLGRSALAVLRLSGAATGEILRAVVPELPDPVPARRALLLPIIGRRGETLDRGLVTFFPTPASYTGEDMAELSIHGSPVLARAVLAALIAAGGRLARPGEFTERAFFLGKVDLIEAEAVRELIEARTERAARFSARRLEGGLSHRLAVIREDLLAAAAELTATIDFSEDVGESVPSSVARRLESAEEKLTALAATHETGKLLESGCRVAIIGPPNAGKSTLFNAVLGSARAIVTEVPGTTRDALEGVVDIGGIPVEVVDTAGLRESNDAVEKIGVARARLEGERADAVVYVYDAKLLKRNDLTIERVARYAPGFDGLSEAERSVLESRVKYEGYIRREEERLARLRPLESRAIPERFDYSTTPGSRGRSSRSAPDVIRERSARLRASRA